jgi:resuscitation-promoting factor RpfB
MTCVTADGGGDDGRLCVFRTRRSALLLGVSATLLLSASLVSLEGLPAQAEPPVPVSDPATAAETIGDRMSVLERATRTAERVEAEKVAAQHKAAKADRAKRIEARKAREAAERKARAEAAAKAQREAEAARSTRTSVRSIAPSSGNTREIGQRMAAARGWTGEQWTCLNNLWTKESGWRTTAQGYTGAYGIPQALPGSKMASAGADWRTNPATQIEWGLNYIGGRYGTPCGAWNAFLSKGWY